MEKRVRKIENKEVVDRGRIGICLACWKAWLGYWNQQQQINLIKIKKNPFLEEVLTYLIVKYLTTDADYVANAANA